MVLARARLSEWSAESVAGQSRFMSRGARRRPVSHAVSLVWSWIFVRNCYAGELSHSCSRAPSLLLPMTVSESLLSHPRRTADDSMFDYSPRAEAAPFGRFPRFWGLSARLLVILGASPGAENQVINYIPRYRIAARRPRQRSYVAVAKHLFTRAPSVGLYGRAQWSFLPTVTRNRTPTATN